MKEETNNNRVRILRKFLKMNQAEFGEKIGLSDSALSRIEKGLITLTDHNILLICTQHRLEHNKTVNEEWLRTGKGDMFIVPAHTDGRPILYDDNGKELPPDEEELIGVYRELIPGNKQFLQDNAKMILNTQKITQGEKGERRADTSKSTI
ncbi:MAG: helix-turn-helix domain-containing protein [Treponema sp.]|nr:helix-turn-helix domain-containing protein [Treponema sp.]